MLSRGHQTVRHKSCSVGQFIPACIHTGHYLVYRSSCISNRAMYFVDSHIVTMGFAVSSQQMLKKGASPGSPPDLTPFTLDKHNTKEKRTFYVRGRVITCRKRDSLIPSGVSPLINHQAMKVSSPNRGLKQTEHGAPLPLLSPPHTSLSSPLFMVGIFMRKEEM